MVGANVASYPDGGFMMGTAYSYRVRAFNAGALCLHDVATATPMQLGSGTGLNASYFDNGDLTT